MAKKNKPDKKSKTSGKKKATEKTIVTELPKVKEKRRKPKELAQDKDYSSVDLGTLINNNYRVQKLIAAGGMGEVFRGENVHTDDPVAIKIILQSLAKDKKIVTLFKREARILGQLSDEAIVRYHNFIHDPALDRYCLVMEYIEGIALSDYVKQQGPLSLEAAKRLIIRLSAGLQKAHKREVTHRDLSPDNVMLRDGSVDQAVLIDFGIAKSAEMSEGTLHGQLAGKFKYISPEQLGHFSGVISARTDVYGLGLLVAAAVCGQALDMGASVVEAVEARREIPDLSCVHPELQPVLSHMLEPNPKDRPATMLDVSRMINDASLIPQKYTTARNIGQPQANERTIISPGLHDGATSLRQPPGAASPISVTQKGRGDTSESPFGGGSAAPFSAGNLNAENHCAAKPPAKKTGIWAAGILTAIAVLGGGWAIMNQTKSTPPIPSNTEPGEIAQKSEPVSKPLAAPDRSTREGFLAAQNTGECTYATRVSVGLNAGKIEGFATEQGRFGRLSGAYGQAFGAQPAVVEKIVTPAQCAALNLLRGLQGRGVIAPVLQLDTDIMKSGGTVVGRVSEIHGRPLWLFLVSDQGGVHNLSPRLKSQADGNYTFSFGMSLAEGADPSAQLIVVIASKTALVSTAAGADGAEAASLLPLIMAEIEGRSGNSAASVGYFWLDGTTAPQTEPEQ